MTQLCQLDAIPVIDIKIPSHVCDYEFMFGCGGRVGLPLGAEDGDPAAGLVVVRDEGCGCYFREGGGVVVGVFVFGWGFGFDFAGTEYHCSRRPGVCSGEFI